MNSDKFRFLEKVLGKGYYYSSTREAMFYCPMCRHHKPKLSINMDTDAWQCFPCGKNGKKLIYVIKEAGGNQQDILEYIEKHKAKHVVFSNKSLQFEFTVNLPDDFVPLAMCKSSVIGKKGYRYLQGRGLSEIDILRHKIGVSADGNAVIFPFFDKSGKINMFTTRGYNGFKKNPDMPRGYKSTIIPNELNVDWKKPLVLVEGPVDMYKSIRNTVPLLGSVLHEDSLLFENIVKNKTEVVLALDPDAWDKSEKIANKLARYDIDVYTVDVGDYEDVGEMAKDQFTEVYASRIFWTPEDSFRKKLRMLC